MKKAIKKKKSSPEQSKLVNSRDGKGEKEKKKKDEDMDDYG